jgi:hypothetical protein
MGGFVKAAGSPSKKKSGSRVKKTRTLYPIVGVGKTVKESVWEHEQTFI